MAPINMVNVPRPGSLPAAPCFQPAAATPAKRKADEATSPNDTNNTAKRHKTAPDQDRPRKPAKTPKAAKPPRRAPKASTASAYTGVATNAVPAQAPATNSNPATSAVSDIPSGIYAGTQQSTTQQCTTTASQASRTAKTPPLTAPLYRPDACFTQSVLSPVTPWPHSFPAPTPRLAQPLPFCPIDWTKVTGLKPEHIEAYELRAPWNPRPETFKAVAQQTQHLADGEQPVEEGVRKRFKRANLAVFKRTGVYFEESAQGLETYGVKKPKKEQATSISSPIATGTATTAAADSTAPGVTQTQPRTTRRSQGYGEAAIYEGEVVAVQLQAPSDRHPTIRVCDKKLIPCYDELIEYDETVADDEGYVEACAPFLPFSTKAFDHWHSCTCFGRVQNFPQRSYVCKEVEDGQYMLRVNSKAKKASIGLMLETYCISQVMGTTKTSMMILNEITAKLSKAPRSALSREDASALQYLPSDDPLYDVVNGFQRKHVGSSSGSEYSAQDDDEYL